MLKLMMYVCQVQVMAATGSHNLHLAHIMKNSSNWSHCFNQVRSSHDMPRKLRVRVLHGIETFEFKAGWEEVERCALSDGPDPNPLAALA